YREDPSHKVAHQWRLDVPTYSNPDYPAAYSATTRASNPERVGMFDAPGLSFPVPLERVWFTGKWRNTFPFFLEPGWVGVFDRSPAALYKDSLTHFTHLGGLGSYVGDSAYIQQVWFQTYLVKVSRDKNGKAVARAPVGHIDWTFTLTADE